ncbi:MAG: hypothetical protein WA020_10445 [Candidatus Acidiferrales bacterium]
MASGSFSTQNAAGQAALDCTAGEAAVWGVEVGGLVNQLPNGQYTFGGVTTGSEGEVTLPIPTSSSIAFFNIEVVPYFGEYVGDEDGDTANYWGMQLYRGTPSGRTLYYDPFDTAQFPYGCVLVGSAVPGWFNQGAIPRCQ